jgi:sorting nexin-14
MPTVVDAESGRRELLERAELPLFWGAVALVFLSFHIGSYPLLWLTVWCFAGGLLSSYLLFRSLPSLPNLLFHLRDPSRTQSAPPLNGHSRPACPVCSQPDCLRHPGQPSREYLQPWDGLVIPSTVDTALTTFLELVLDKFVYSWQRDLLHDDAFVDEVRVSIRHAAASLFRRARKIDIPSLITGKIMRAAAAHFHLCLQAKEKCGYYYIARSLSLSPSPSAQCQQGLASLSWRQLF